MSVYDKLGNMNNERAAMLACDVAQQVEELFEALFRTEGMTIVEARALLGYIKTQIDCPVIMSFLR